MTKRKRSNPKEGAPGTPAESGEGDPAVHVSSDMLAGAPDVFAPGKEMPVESSESSAMTADVKPEEEHAPAAETASAFDESQSTEGPAEPAAAQAAITPPPPPPPPSYQPRPPSFVAPGPSQRRAGSSVPLGVALVAVGLSAFLSLFPGFDRGESWPLFIVI